jgi:hypothetical protein
MQRQANRGTRFRRKLWEAPKPAYVAPPIQWPVYVTDGMQPVGPLCVLTFKSREELQPGTNGLAGRDHGYTENLFRTRLCNPQKPVARNSPLTHPTNS